MPEPPAPPPAPSPDRQALDRLADALVADVLATPDAEILAEFRETDGDPEQYAAQMRVAFERVVQQESPAPDLAAIELCAERVAADDEVRGQDAWQLSALHVPALVAYARALEAANARLREALAPLATVPLTDISPGEVARARALLTAP